MRTNKKVLYGAIVYCVIIGAIYVILSVLALLTREKWFGVKSSPFIYMLYLLYFRVENVEPNIDWGIFVTNSSMGPVNIPSETVAVQRTFIFTILYLALNVALIVTALIAYTGIAMSLVGRRSFIVFIGPLVTLLVASIVCDGMVTIYYIIDAVSTWKVDGLISLLEIGPTDDRHEIKKLLGAVSIFTRCGPSIVMALSTAKLFVAWVLNALLCAVIVRHGWSLAGELDEESSKNYQNAIMANDNPAFEDEYSHKANTNPMARSTEITHRPVIHGASESPRAHHQPAQDRLEHRYHDTSRSIDHVYPHQIYAKSKKQKWTNAEDEIDSDFKIQRPALTSQKSSGRTTPAQQPPSYQKDPEIESRMRRFEESNGQAMRNAFAYENAPKQGRDSQYANVNAQQREARPRPNPPPKPMNNNNNHKFYLQSTGHEEPIRHRSNSDSSNSRVDRSSSGVKAPQELKSQLPWSYFKSGENAPRRTLMHEQPPQVPMPDYSSPAKQRRYFDAADDDELWTSLRY